MISEVDMIFHLLRPIFYTKRSAMIAITCILLISQSSINLLDLLGSEPVNQICHAEEVDPT